MQIALEARRNGQVIGRFRVGARASRKIVIGSLPRADVCIEGLPRLRAAIHVHGASAHIIDMGGGMSVNGAAAHRASLAVGDVVELGDVEIVRVDADDAAPTRPDNPNAGAGLGALVVDASPAADSAPMVSAGGISLPFDVPVEASEAPALVRFDGDPSGRAVRPITAERLRRAAVQSQPHPALPPEDVVSGSANALEMRLYCGENLLDLRHYVRPATVTIGEDKRADVFLSSEGLPGDPFPLIRTVGDGTFLCFSDGMHGEIEMDGRVAPLEEWRARAHSEQPGSHALRLSLDARAVLHWAGMTFALRFVAPPKKQRASLRGMLDLPFANTVLASMLVHAMALATLAVVPHDAEAMPDDRWQPVVLILDSPIGKMMQEPPEAKRELLRRIAMRKTSAKPERTRHPAVAAPTPAGALGRTPSSLTGRTTTAEVRAQFSAMLSYNGSLIPRGPGGMVGSLTSFIPSVGIGPRGSLAPAPLGPVDAGGGDGTPGGQLIRIGGVDTTRGPGGGLDPRPPGRSLGERGPREVGGIEGVEVVDVTTHASLGREVIAEVIRKNRMQARFCYERRLQLRKDLEGRLVVSFTIGPDGRVRDARVKDSTVGDAEVEACLLERVSTWRFPEPAGGGTVEVNYPFVFRAD